MANRGESAARVLVSAGPLGWRTVVPWVGQERAHWWASLADEAIALPDGAFTEPLALARAAREAGCQAVHPGWGLLAESPEFAQAVLDEGLVWVGPSPAVLRRLGDKGQAAELAASLGIPTFPGGPIAPGDPAPLGPYPVLAKARRSGGGLGQALAESPEAWPAACEAALAQTRASFGEAAAEAGLMWAPWMADARHVEVQVAGDAQGQVLSLGLRDCSVQRRRQKLVEESPSPGLPTEQGEALEAWACALLRSVGYQGLGTVEFLVRPGGASCFLEVNARLQVEHPLTEWRWGLDLVALQLGLAQGRPLAELGPRSGPVGWAMEVRLLSEDPFTGLPCPGRVERVLWPGGPFVRLDPGVGAPDEIDPRFDPMIAKLSAWGRDREEARLRLLGALQRLEVVGGLRHNQARLIHILQDPDFCAGRHHTAWDAHGLASAPWEGEAPWASRPIGGGPAAPPAAAGWPAPAWRALGRGGRP